MVWCLSLAVLSLIISQGADGELDSLGSGAPCGPWGGGHSLGGFSVSTRGRGRIGLLPEKLRILSTSSQSPRECSEVLREPPVPALILVPVVDRPPPCRSREA